MGLSNRILSTLQSIFVNVTLLIMVATKHKEQCFLLLFLKFNYELGNLRL